MIFRCEPKNKTYQKRHNVLIRRVFEATFDYGKIKLYWKIRKTESTTVRVIWYFVIIGGIYGTVKSLNSCLEQFYRYPTMDVVTSYEQQDAHLCNRRWFWRESENGIFIKPTHRHTLTPSGRYLTRRADFLILLILSSQHGMASAFFFKDPILLFLVSK